MFLTNSFFKRYLNIFLLINLSVYNALGQESINKNTNGKYGVGYSEYKTKDTSRQYKPGVSKENALFFRPIELDVWYPAKASSKNAPLAFRYFVSLFESRANSFQDSIKYNGLAEELMQHFTVADKDKSSRIAVKTRSCLNAEEIKGRFPMIIYMSAYNGMSYENIPLFENLASHGYVVVSISSMGRYPGNMTTKYPDVLEQVRDADFAMRWMYNRNIDTSKIAIIGYSYGGLAGAMLAMQNRSIKALLSLDGSEMHVYGEDKEEDKDFNDLRKSKYFDPLALKCSYAYLASDHKDDGVVDSIYHLQTPTGIKNYYIRLIDTEHEDFSCLQNLGSYINTPYELVNKLALNYFDQYLNNKKSIFDNTTASVLSEKKGSGSFNKAVIKTTRTSGQILLKGKIAVAGSNSPIPYVSLGIPAGSNGTIADSAGNFSLTVDETLANDIIRISSLGYQSKSFTVKELFSFLSAEPLITLDKQENQLHEVVIKAKKVHFKTIGNTSKSKFFNVGFALKELGSEVGVNISLGKKTVWLRTFNFSISYLRLDSATFRFNVYAIKRGLPAENLLNQNIFIGIGNRSGTYTIDLKPYKLLLKGDVLVSLEWIKGRTSNSNGAVFFSAGLLSSSYHRKTTEANWVRFKGLGAGFNMQVQENE